MFERYTERARRSIFFARWEASKLGSLYIEPEHLLLGLIRYTSIPADAIRAEIEKEVPHREPVSTSVDLPVSGSLKIALRRAAEEADGLGHQNIEVKHLLLGLLDGDGTVASMLLRKHGIGRESVLREIQENPLEATNDPELLRAIGIGARNRG